MSHLDLKVPPDVVALVVGAFMWGVSLVTPALAFSSALRALPALALLLVGCGFIVAARLAFAHADTTFSPVSPDRSRHLVVSGVYHLTRNPMYLGTLLVLLALAIWLSSPAAALVSLAYVAYIDRFQIRPEERVLHARFGSAYERYVASVRRWA